MLKSYNSNGARLISRIKKHEYMPLGNVMCYASEYVKAETNFGKGKYECFSYFDALGKLIRREIVRKFGKNDVEKTVFSYEGDLQVRLKTIIKKSRNRKNVESIIKSEVLSKSKDDNKPVLTRVVLSLTPKKDKSRHEVQVIEELSTNSHRRYIKTTASRNKNGEISDKTFESNITNSKKLSKSPYLHFRGYSLKDFLVSILPYAKKKQKVQNRDIEYAFESLSEKVAANSVDLGDNSGIITFDMDKMNSRSHIVNTVNHEFRHQYQSKMVEKFEESGFRNFIRKIFNPLKYYFAKRCDYGFKNYVSLTVDVEKYNKNFVEIDAKNIGQKARAEFLAETRLLDDIFPYSKELFTGNEEYYNVVISAKKASSKKNIAT